jgi:putative hydroxymethylpyrimidine transport system ATP-binding protein
MPPGIDLRGLGLRYAGAVIFEQLSLILPPGEISVLLGPSGAGKTSLLRIIAGLEPADEGAVSATDSAPLAGRISYMAQQDLLLPWASALKNVMLGARLRGEPENAVRAAALLDEVGLTHRANARPAELSGGERQRVALARTLYEDRPVVLMDEPFSSLDAITRVRMQDLAAKLLAGRTVLLITHDPFEACRLGHSFTILSGSPARLTTPTRLPGNPPRAPDEDGILHLQGDLLRQLAQGVA